MHPTPSTSASPAPHRVSSLVRRTDGPSPSKRRKLATQSPASTCSSYSISAPDPQLDADRRASSTRVLTLWSALENKYTRRLNEDDILDLRTGGFVKDRGVLSGKAGTWNIGCFADGEQVQGESAALEGEDDDPGDGDEIGGWGSGSELDHQFNPIHVPPVQELDPKDAEDLRAFLAAEETRKMEQGVEEDLSEDEPPDGDRHLDSPHGGETDGSVVEVEAESALAMSEAESDDELAGYDETVGDGALLWEVGTRLENASVPSGIESDHATANAVPTLALRNMTPAQLRTPPPSHSSAISPQRASFPPRRPPLNLSPPSPPRQQDHSTIPRSTNRRGKQKETRSPEPPDDALQSKWTSLRREGSVSPTKKLLAEVFVPSPRCGSVRVKRNVPANQDQSSSPPRPHDQTASTSIRRGNSTARRPSDYGPNMSSTSQPRRRHSMPSIATDAQLVDIDDQVGDVPKLAFEARSSEESWSPASPRRNARRKRVLFEDTNMGNDRIAKTWTSEDSGEDDNATSSEAFAAPPRRRRSSTTIPRSHRTTTSNPADISPSPSLQPLRHASAVPATSFDFWHPYERQVSVAPPFSNPYPPHAAHDPGVPPLPPLGTLDAQFYLTRALQTLGYMALGAPPPDAPTFCHPNTHPHQPPAPAPQTPAHLSKASPSWLCPSPHFHQPASHSPPHPHGSAWLYPRYAYPCSPAAHLQHGSHASSSSPFPLSTPRAGDEPPSSPRQCPSSPMPSLSRKGKRKVYFSDEDAGENVQSEVSCSGKDTAKRPSVALVPRARRNSRGSNMARGNNATPEHGSEYKSSGGSKSALGTQSGTRKK